MSSRRTYWNVLAGGLVIALAAAFCYGALQYRTGSLARIGPGAFPLLAAAILLFLGILLAVKQPSRDDEVAVVQVNWRPLVCIFFAITGFALMVQWSGLIAASLWLICCATIADRNSGLLAIFCINVIALSSVVGIFYWLLAMPVPLY